MMVKPIKSETIIREPDSQDEPLDKFMNGRLNGLQGLHPKVDYFRASRDPDGGSEHVVTVGILNRRTHHVFELAFQVIEFPSGELWLCCGPDNWFREQVRLKRLDTLTNRHDKQVWPTKEGEVNAFGAVRAWLFDVGSPDWHRDVDTEGGDDGEKS